MLNALLHASSKAHKRVLKRDAKTAQISSSRVLGLVGLIDCDLGNRRSGKSGCWTSSDFGDELALPKQACRDCVATWALMC